MKFGFKPSSTPNSLDGNRFEGEGSSQFGFRISDCGFQIRRFCRAFLSTPKAFGAGTDVLQANATICQILVAIADLARRDLRRVYQRHVVRAYVAIHRTVLAVVKARHVAESNLDNSRRCSQMRAYYRIRGSRSSPVASTSHPSKPPYETVDGFWRSTARLRAVCRNR